MFLRCYTVLDTNVPHDSTAYVKSDITHKVVNPPADAKINNAIKVMDPPVDMMSNIATIPSAEGVMKHCIHGRNERKDKLILSPIEGSTVLAAMYDFLSTR
ncbi:hypothetical protein A2U01_0060537 [Trifolium medium]|uniref:Uncharacterized protein n=1 Tax=Trifolium medium TaxID=97028 RepID=A0A392RUP3_9FABA|nr:hypothetical protein [Trifolium medium]